MSNSDYVNIFYDISAPGMWRVNVGTGVSNSTTWGTPPCPYCGEKEILLSHVCELKPLPEVLRRHKRSL